MRIQRRLWRRFKSELRTLKLSIPDDSHHSRDNCVLFCRKNRMATKSLTRDITSADLNSTKQLKAATICPAPVTLTFDLLNLKVMSESRVMWATSVPILVFLLDLGPMYACTQQIQTDRRQTASLLNAPT